MQSSASLLEQVFPLWLFSSMLSDFSPCVNVDLLILEFVIPSGGCIEAGKCSGRHVLALEADLDTYSLCLQQFSDTAKDLSAPSNNLIEGHRMTFVEHVEAKMKMKMKTKIRPSPSVGSQTQ
jgi:hypothetical protein